MLVFFIFFSKKEITEGKTASSIKETKEQYRENYNIFANLEIFDTI